MKSKPIIIIPGDPKSIFFEIFFKSIKLRKYQSPLVLIFNHKDFNKQMKRFKIKKRLRIIEIDNIKNIKLDNTKINLINIDSQIKNEISRDYINKSFKVAFKLIKSNFTYKIINGPINKKKFFNKKFLGVTEYLANNFKKKVGMLIYNKELSVCPLTTHLPVKQVAKKITKKLILEKVHIIDIFYRKFLGYKPNIGVTGLNPHCESILKINEDDKIIAPTIKHLKKKKFKISGPFSADTIFLKNNRKKFDVILGMYHDQVLTPVKTLFEYDAINITMGLPFLRVSPDHGPNEKMVGKNKSNPLSLIKALSFLDQR